MVFFGEYQLSITAPGRLVLPKKIRGLIRGNIFVLTKGFTKCLFGYDKDNWEERAKTLMSDVLTNKENLEQKRLIFASSHYLEIDEQGRFLLPKNLILYADLKDKATIIGVGDHFEIWDQEKWEIYKKQIEKSEGYSN